MTCQQVRGGCVACQQVRGGRATYQQARRGHAAYQQVRGCRVAPCGSNSLSSIHSVYVIRRMEAGRAEHRLGFCDDHVLMTSVVEMTSVTYAQGFRCSTAFCQAWSLVRMHASCKISSPNVISKNHSKSKVDCSLSSTLSVSLCLYMKKGVHTIMCNEKRQKT